jgi:OPA family sugar phosphate sensor protein UhpC-like MFS transporter
VGSAALVTWFGWQYGFLGPGALCVLVAMAMFLALQDRPATLGLPPVKQWKDGEGPVVSKPAAAKESRWKLQLKVLKMPSIWILGLSSATMYMTRYAINSWGILYLQEAKGYSLIKAGSMLGINTFAGILGCVAYGFISDKVFKTRRPPMNLICAVLEIIALVIIFFAPPGRPVLITFAFIIYGFGLNGLITSLGGLFAVDIAPKKAAGAAMGFIGVFSYLGAALQERISGGIIERGTTLVDGVRHYDFSTAVLYWIGSSVLSLVLAATLWRVKVRD